MQTNPVSKRYNILSCLSILFSIAIFLHHNTHAGENTAKDSWFFEAEKGDVNVELNGNVEKDPHASGGQAVVAITGRNTPFLYHRPLYSGPCSWEIPWGEYEVTFKMKVSNIKSKKNVVRIDVKKEQAPRNEKPLYRWEIPASAFATPDKYQEFKFTFIHDPYQWLQFNVVWLGEADFSFDCYTIKATRIFSAEEISARAPWTALDQLKKPDNTLEVLFLKGPAYQFQKIDESLQSISDKCIYNTFMRESYVFREYRLDGYFPDINGHFASLDIIIMGGIDAEALGSKRMKRISEFASNCGGGILMLPGPYSFGKGRFQYSPIETVLPVKLKGPWDWKKFSKPEPISLTKEIPELGNSVTFKNPPYALWYTDIDLPLDAKVILKAGDVPLLAVKKCGNGRSAAILALPCGEWDFKEKTPFWQHEEWPVLMKNLLIWLAAEGEVK